MKRQNCEVFGLVKQAEEHPYLTLTEICAMLGEHTLPSWQELPELELYMDQVLSHYIWIRCCPSWKDI